MTSSVTGHFRNILSIDVEDYFHVSAFDSPRTRANWDRFESRVERNTRRLLDIFAEASVRGTFFVLGWVAERYPKLIREIAGGGHEIASHGYGHQLVYDLAPAAFRADLQRARRAIEDACGQRVVGYRAPSFSITRRSLWALDVLAEEGYVFDSSVFPIARDRYGIPGAPRWPYAVHRPSGSILEVPASTVAAGRVTLPVAGGGYFRMYPYAWTSQAIRHLNAQGRPAVVYLHPWEIDPDQPRQQGSALSRFRHYVNLERTESRLRRLVAEFSFGSMSEVTARAAAVPASIPSAASARVGGVAVQVPSC